VKSFPGLSDEKVDAILNESFLLTQVKHQCIAPLIGIILPTESTPLQTATLFYSCGSLQEVLNTNPVWWTPTTKAKAIAGIALGMKSAHEFGIVHGSLKPNNFLFDKHHCVHITDFGSSGFECKGDEEDGLDENRWGQEMENARNADVFSFASILFNILIGEEKMDEEENQRTKNGEFRQIPASVPMFVRQLIENGSSPDRLVRPSFDSIIYEMKRNHFDFAEGVEVCEIFDFVNSAEESYF
jgi:serine/threonine protein kinase